MSVYDGLHRSFHTGDRVKVLLVSFTQSLTDRLEEMNRVGGELKKWGKGI